MTPYHYRGYWTLHCRCIRGDKEGPWFVVIPNLIEKKARRVGQHSQGRPWEKKMPHFVTVQAARNYILNELPNLNVQSMNGTDTAREKQT